jgi:hypothetical protein
MSITATSQRPPSFDTRRHVYAPTVDPFIGQRFIAAIVDVCFFAVIALFGIHKIIGEVLIGTLLSSYAAYRFGVAQGKQQAVTAMSNSGAFGSGGGGSGGPSSGSGGSTSQPRFQAVRPDERAESAPITPSATESTERHCDREDTPSADANEGSFDPFDPFDPFQDPRNTSARTMMLGLTRR